ELFDRVVVEQQHPAVAADSIVAGVQVLVEDVGGGVVPDAIAQVDDHVLDFTFVGAVKVHRQRNDLELDDQRADEHAFALDVNAAGGFAEDGGQQLRVEHVLVELQVVVHHVVE